MSGSRAGRRESSGPAGDCELRARFFGGFEVLYRGRVVDLGRNSRAVAILKHLLARSPHPVSRDALMGWLWPESGPRRARWSLNSAVYALRRVLEENGGAELSGCVVLEGDRYRLSPEVRLSSDVEEFDAGYEKGLRHQRAGRVEEGRREYEGAVALYRGDYLVEDVYEDWTMIERERLSGAYVDMLERLAGYYVDHGHPRKSIELCYRVLERDPCHEESYRRLMRCYSRQGLRSRATQQYGLCGRMLGRLYGMSPSAETRSLHERILRGEEV